MPKREIILYPHRNGEVDAPEQVGYYWVEYGEATYLAHSSEIRPRLRHFTPDPPRYYGPLPIGKELVNA